MEHHGKSPFLIGKPSINGPFSMAMLNNQRVKYPSIYTNVFNSKDVFPVFHSNAALKNPCFWCSPFWLDLSCGGFQSMGVPHWSSIFGKDFPLRSSWGSPMTWSTQRPSLAAAARVRSTSPSWSLRPNSSAGRCPRPRCSRARRWNCRSNSWLPFLPTFFRVNIYGEAWNMTIYQYHPSLS